jgi:hypothetical protein
MTAQSWHSQSNNCSPSPPPAPCYHPQEVQCHQPEPCAQHEHSDCGHSCDTLSLNVHSTLVSILGGMTVTVGRDARGVQRESTPPSFTAAGEK